MGEFLREVSDPANLPLQVAAIALIAGALSRSPRKRTVLMVLAGLAVLGWFAFVLASPAGIFWSALLVIAAGAELIRLQNRARQGLLLKEERVLIEQVLEVQDPAQQRRLRDVLEWRDIDVGQVLMSEGQAEPPLIYIAHGEAEIRHDGKVVGTCSAGDFLGEMSLLSGHRASATVTVTQKVRLANVDRDALVQLADAIPELSRAFERALNRGLTAKVVRMNDTLAARDG